MNNVKRSICLFIAKKAEKKAKSSVREVSLDGIYQPKTPAVLLKK
ncbi:MAG: hypothetical protein RSC76_03360 [Oscillospiraceae bacterium]